MSVQAFSGVRFKLYSAVTLALLACGCQSTPPATSQPYETDAPVPSGSSQPVGHVIPKLTVNDIASTLASIRTNLDAKMVIRVTDSAGKRVQYPAGVPVPSNANAIGCTGYPAGVIYAGMLAAGDATGDRSFTDFAGKRFQFFADTIPTQATEAELRRSRSPYHAWLAPVSLDSCGAMGAAFVKARRAEAGGNLEPQIRRFAEFVSHRQFRLPDGTLARNRPFSDSLWADDMYMSVPFLAQLGALNHDNAYYDDAAKQVLQISARLFVPSSGLYTHGWDARTGDNQPTYYWGRANGWCAMAMVELLEVLPADHPRREQIIQQLRALARGVASVQSGTGLWHQMLDRPDSYPETSCSAMFTFAIARAVNRGWLDAGAYGPVAIAGWHGVTSRIDSNGHVTGTCVGTSYAMDYPYYYNRTFTDDQHGYGPVLLAGSEIIQMLKNPRLQVENDAGKPVMVLPR
jgi:rhamnogalacturonyl hydrolase YesR